MHAEHHDGRGTDLDNEKAEQDEHDDQRRQQRRDGKGGQRPEQARQQSRNELQTTAKREQHEGDGKTAEGAGTRTREGNEQARSDDPDDEDAALETRPEAAHRDGAHEDVERCPGNGRTRQNAHCRQARRHGEEGEQQIDDEEHRQVRREGQRRAD